MLGVSDKSGLNPKASHWPSTSDNCLARMVTQIQLTLEITSVHTATEIWHTPLLPSDTDTLIVT